MKGNVTCSCGHSWSKSDSSKEDMNVCHICGKDNTMKNGGWLEKFDVGGDIDPFGLTSAKTDVTRTKAPATKLLKTKEQIKREAELEKAKLAAEVAKRQTYLSADTKTPEQRAANRTRVREENFINNAPLTQSLAAMSPNNNPMIGRLAAQTIIEANPIMSAARVVNSIKDPANNAYGIGPNSGLLQNTLGFLGAAGDVTDLGNMISPALKMARGLRNINPSAISESNQLPPPPDTITLPGTERIVDKMDRVRDNFWSGNITDAESNWLWQNGGPGSSDIYSPFGTLTPERYNSAINAIQRNPRAEAVFTPREQSFITSRRTDLNSLTGVGNNIRADIDALINPPINRNYTYTDFAQTAPFTPFDDSLLGRMHTSIQNRLGMITDPITMYRSQTPLQSFGERLYTGITGRTGRPNRRVSPSSSGAFQIGNGGPLTNKSGFTKEDVLARASDEAKEAISKMSEDEFAKTVLTPDGKVSKLTYDNPIDEYKRTGEIQPLTYDEYTERFNSQLDLLNDIIARNNTSGVDYTVSGIDAGGQLKFYTPSMSNNMGGVQSWSTRISPGEWRGEVQDVASPLYYQELPGINMSASSASVFPDYTARRGTGAYQSINEYLKALDLGRVKPGFNSQSTSSFGLWDNAVKKGTASGYYSSPRNVYGAMKKKGGKIEKNGGWLDKFDDGGELENSFDNVKASQFKTINQGTVNSIKNDMASYINSPLYAQRQAMHPETYIGSRSFDVSNPQYFQKSTAEAKRSYRLLDLMNQPSEIKNIGKFNDYYTSTDKKTVLNKSNLESVVAHELGHSLFKKEGAGLYSDVHTSDYWDNLASENKSSLPLSTFLNQKEVDKFKDFAYPIPNQDEHYDNSGWGAFANESYADLTGIRYLLHKHGLTKNFGDKINKGLFDKALKVEQIKSDPIFKRMQQKYSPGKIILLNNTIAQNNSPQQEITQAEYGAELNYNDYSVSAPEGFQGDGYSNVGRNYSPAWGGQFEDGGTIPMAQDGLTTPATRSDSVNVYNSAKAVQDYYKTKGYKKLDTSKDTELWKQLANDHLKKIENIKKNKGFTKKQKELRIKQYKEDVEEYTKKAEANNPKNYLGALADSKKAFEEDPYSPAVIEFGAGYKDKEGIFHASKPPLEEYYKPIDENTFNQREQSYGFLDLRSPMPLYDRRITPQGFSNYFNPNPSDNVQMYEYDPLAVMPWDMIPAEQQEERIRKFGTSGAPADILKKNPSWTTPVASTPVATPSTSQSVIDWMEGNDYAQDFVPEAPVQQKARPGLPFGFIEDPRSHEMHMYRTSTGELEYPFEGGQTHVTPKMDNGGPVKKFLQPTQTFMNLGYNPKENGLSTEYSTTVGKDGEYYLVPGFKQGRLVEYPEDLFNQTGEHLGGPFKTIQAAEDFAKFRHDYVEKNKNIPAPFKTRDYAMGGSIPGAVGFTYARTINPAPSNGKYAKKTMASAADGIELMEGEETQPVKTPAIKSEERTKQEEALMNRAPLDIIEEGRSRFRFDMLQDAVKHDMALEQGVGLNDINQKDSKKKTMELLLKREKQLSNPTVEFVKGSGKFENVPDGSLILGYYDTENKNALVSLSDNLDRFNIDEFGNAVRHEFRHAYDNAGRYLTNYEKELIGRKTNTDNVEKQKALGSDRYEYLKTPTEVTARLQEIRGALKDNPRLQSYRMQLPESRPSNSNGFGDDSSKKRILERVPVYEYYDPRKNKATLEHLNSLKNTSGLQDLLKIMKPEDVVELLNTIATNNPQQGMPMAQNGMEMKYYQEGLDWRPKSISKNGSQLKKLDQLTNFTNYNPTQPSGWLEKYQ
jgi:hypothetical protein